MDRTQHLVTMFDGGCDFVWICGPCEGFWFVSLMDRLIVACRSTTNRKTPGFDRCLDSLAKQPVTVFSQEHEVGVKWKTKRSCLTSSHSPTLGYLWAA